MVPTHAPRISRPIDGTLTSHKRKHNSSEAHSTPERPTKLDRRDTGERNFARGKHQSLNNLAPIPHAADAATPMRSIIREHVSSSSSCGESAQYEMPGKRNDEYRRPSGNNGSTAHGDQPCISLEKLDAEDGKHPRSSLQQYKTIQDIAKSEAMETKVRTNTRHSPAQLKCEGDRLSADLRAEPASDHEKYQSRHGWTQQIKSAELLPKATTLISRRTIPDEVNIRPNTRRRQGQSISRSPTDHAQPSEKGTKPVLLDHEDDVDELQLESPPQNGQLPMPRRHTAASHNRGFSEYFTPKVQESRTPQDFSIPQDSLDNLAQFEGDYELKGSGKVEVSAKGHLSLVKNGMHHCVELSTFKMAWYEGETILLFSSPEKQPEKSDVVLTFKNSKSFNRFLELLKSTMGSQKIYNEPPNRMDGVMVRTWPSPSNRSNGSAEELELLNRRSRLSRSEASQIRNPSTKGPKLCRQLQTAQDSISPSSEARLIIPREKHDREVEIIRKSPEPDKIRWRLGPTPADFARDPLHQPRRSNRLQGMPQSSPGICSPRPKPVNLGSPWKSSLIFPPSGSRKVTLTFEDLQRLREEEFLNDNVIEFGIRHAQWNYAKHAEKVYFFNTYFYSALTTLNSGQQSINYEAVRRWTSKVNLFDYNFVVVPINEDLHWYLAIICNLRNIQRDSSEKEQLKSNLDTVIIDDTASKTNSLHVLPSDDDDVDNPMTKTAMVSHAPASQASAVMDLEREPVVSLPTAYHNTASEFKDPEPSKPNVGFSTHLKETSTGRQLQEDLASQCDSGTKSPNTVNLTKDDDGRLSKPLMTEDGPDPVIELSSQADSFGLPMKKRRKRGKRSKSVLDPDAPTIMILDSLSQSHTHVTRNLKNYLIREAKLRQGWDMKPLADTNVQGIPKQSNWCDCGIYLLAYLEKFLKDPAEFVRKALMRELKGEQDLQTFSPSKKRSFYRETILDLHRNQEHLKAEQLSTKSNKLESHSKVLPSPRKRDINSNELPNHREKIASHGGAIDKKEASAQPMAEKSFGSNDATSGTHRDMLLEESCEAAPHDENFQQLHLTTESIIPPEGCEDDDMLENPQQLEGGTAK